MKYLSDTEILNWNRRLEKSDYAVHPLSNVRSGHPDIIFRQKINYSDLLISPIELYNFFGISKSFFK